MCNSANSNPNYHNPQQHVHEITGSTATVNATTTVFVQFPAKLFEWETLMYTK